MKLFLTQYYCQEKITLLLIITITAVDLNPFLATKNKIIIFQKCGILQENVVYSFQVFSSFFLCKMTFKIHFVQKIEIAGAKWERAH